MPVFRNITEEHIEEIAELEKQTFSDAWSRQSIYETFCQKQAFITVAEVDGALVGYCIIYFVMDEGEIARIAVKEDVRRQGVGRGLLDYTCRCCKEKKIKRLLLDVRESNKGAIAFYKTYGFVEDGLRRNFYEMPQEHAVLMSKDLCNTGSRDNVFH